MGLEDRYSTLGSKFKDITGKSVITDNSPLAFKSLDVKVKPSITNDSTLAFKPVETKSKPISASTLIAKPLNPTEKLSGGILNKRSLFGAAPARSFYIPTISQGAGPSPSPTPIPTPTPGIGAFSTAYSNAYDGMSISAFSAAFSNAF